MAGVIRYKIWYDLWENKNRTLQVVLIIAIGAFAIGAVLGAIQFIREDITRTWTTTAPAAIGLTVKPSVNDDTIHSMGHVPNVGQAVGWQMATIEWRAGPDQPWQAAVLYGIDDYQHADLRKIIIDSGSYPREDLIGVQRGYGLNVGQTVELKITDDGTDRQHAAQINGVLYNAASPPPCFVPNPVFYVTRARFTALTGQPGYNLILATLPNYTPEKATAAANVMQDRLEKENVQVQGAMSGPGGIGLRTTDPTRHPVQDVLDGIFFILTTMAVLSLILGLFLVSNTITAIITQQTDQIGIMKAIGGNFWQITITYLELVWVYALLALLLAIPLGALGAQGIRVSMITLINQHPGSFELSFTAILAQVGVALIAPLLVALFPITAGARVTVREAVSTYGLSGTGGWFDRLVTSLIFIPRLVALTINNTFRNKKRVLLTQLTLVGSGLIFMMVMSTRSSVQYTFGQMIFSIYDSQVMLQLRDVARIPEIEQLVEAVPGVKAVEMWGAAQANIRLADLPKTDDETQIDLRGLPLPSQTYRPQLVAGRWLEPGDSYALVLNQSIANTAGLTVGDAVKLDIPNVKEAKTWQIVGLLSEPFDNKIAIVSRNTLLKELGQTGRTALIRVQTQSDSAAGEAAISNQLQQLFESRNMKVVADPDNTAHRLTDDVTGRFDIIISLLAGMAILIAIVGGVALSGVMSINVIERTREIGVMRAIGASSRAVAGQFIGEGLILGWLSWLIAFPLSLPTSRLMVWAIGQTINFQLSYQYSPGGALYWLVIITVLAVLASWLPARRAAQTSVRESLAYV